MHEISVIVPVYNTGKYLDQCLKSLKNQTFKDIEVIIVDDGSPDNSKEIYDRYTGEDDRFKAVRIKNVGVSGARNHGLDMAGGKYVLFVDSDDWMPENACEIMHEEAEKSHLDMVAGNICEVNKSKSREIRLFSKEFTGKDMIENYQITCIGYGYNPYPIDMDSVSGYGSMGNKLYRKDIIDKYHIRFDMDVNNMYEDNLFTIEYLNYAGNIGYISKPVYYYRYVLSSSSNRFKANSLETSDQIFKKIDAVVGQKDNKLFRKAKYIYVIRRLSAELAVYYFHKDSNLRLSESLKILKKRIKSEPYKEAIKRVDVKRLMAPHKLACLTARTGSPVIVYMGYKLRVVVKNILRKLRGRKNVG